MLKDELKKLVPTADENDIAVICMKYESCEDFCVDMDRACRIAVSDKMPDPVPDFSEPWDEIISDIRTRMSTGKNLLLSFGEAVGHVCGPSVGRRLNDILKIYMVELRKGSKKHSVSEYQAQMSSMFSLKKNICTNRIELNGTPMTDGDESEIRLQMKEAGFDDKQMIIDMTSRIARRNAYHPIRDYLAGLTWDGVARIDLLANYFDYQQSIFPSVLLHWFIGSVGRIMDMEQNPMLVLDGPQGCGKSTFARWVCPLEDYFREGSINPDNKDHQIACAGTWVWEVAELGSTIRRKDRDALKEFLTQKVFSCRAPYGKHNENYTAMSSFIGTVNNEVGVLNDPTGSRRFRPVTINSINIQYQQDFKQEDLWAEAYAYWKQGKTYALHPDEEKEMEEIRLNYQIVDPIEEVIKIYFYIDPSNMSLTMNYNEIRTIIEDPLQGNLHGSFVNSTTIGSALNTLGVKKVKKKINHKTSLIYYGIKPAYKP